MAPLSDAVLTQLRLLKEANARPDVAVHAVERNALHFLLLALKAEVDADTQTEIDAYLKTRAQAHTYLLELAQDWRCSGCGSRVPGGAAFTKSRLFIICKACEAKSPASERGTAALHLHFPVGPGWNPERSGFDTGEP
jgi:hypothetical protein